MLRLKFDCVGGNNQLFGELPELGVGLLFARIGSNAVDARQHANNVAVEDGRGLIEGDAANRAGGVATDAGQGEDGVEGVRESEGRISGGRTPRGPNLGILSFSLGVVELRPPIGDNLLRRFLQVADAGVVAEAFPEFVDFICVCVGETFDGGQLAHPAFPIRDDGFHLRLLEHDFRHPDGVGIARAPPREVAGVGGEPVEQQRDEFLIFTF